MFKTKKVKNLEKQIDALLYLREENKKIKKDYWDEYDKRRLLQKEVDDLSVLLKDMDIDKEKYWRLEYSLKQMNYIHTKMINKKIDMMERRK